MRRYGKQSFKCEGAGRPGGCPAQYVRDVDDPAEKRSVLDTGEGTAARIGVPHAIFTSDTKAVAPRGHPQRKREKTTRFPYPLLRPIHGKCLRISSHRNVVLAPAMYMVMMLFSRLVECMLWRA